LSDPRATDWIAGCLIERRDKIAKAWFSKVLALDRFRIADGRLAFNDLSASYGTGTPKSYKVRWSTYDNDHGVLTPLSNERETTQEKPGDLSVLLPEMHGDGYWVAALESPERPRQSVHVYVSKRGEVATVVGVDRAW
jgi:hypothetical protein